MDYMEIIREVSIVAIVAYFLGSIPTGYLVVKILKGEDIRKIGSGSTGATNVKRVMGTGWFFAVMLLDAMKGFFSVLLAIYFTICLEKAAVIPSVVYNIGLLPVVAAVFSILGHSKSVFLGFTGGKSVATGVGTLLALNWITGLSVAGIWAVVTWLSRYVSFGSILAIATAPILMWFLKVPTAYLIYAVIAAVYVIYLHRENIVRLIDGNENKVR